MPGMAGGEKAKARAAGDLRELGVHVFEDGAVLLLRGFAMSPFLERDEEDAAVGRVDAAEEVVAGDGRVVFDARRVLQDLLALAHDLRRCAGSEAESGRMTWAKK